MTVIAWDGRTLAADRLIVAGGNMKAYIRKLHCVNHHNGGVCAAAMAGSTSLCNDLLAWFKNGEVPEMFPQQCRDGDDLPSMIVTIPGQRCVAHYQGSPHPTIIENQFYAIGSGRDFAMAGMHCGKSALEAVKIACIYDAYCGGRVDTADVDEHGVRFDWGD
jgi:ATP-dependent protease HslVU (ClpYQ) peptidase subunit